MFVPFMERCEGQNLLFYDQKFPIHSWIGKLDITSGSILFKTQPIYHVVCSIHMVLESHLKFELAHCKSKVPNVYEKQTFCNCLFV